jgi:hypothetical protein
MITGYFDSLQRLRLVSHCASGTPVSAGREPWLDLGALAAKTPMMGLDLDT